MKFFGQAVVIFLLYSIAGCKKESYPAEVVETGNSEFFFSGKVDGEPMTLEAGKDGYYLYSAHDQDSTEVYNFTGAIKKKDCNACPNSLEIVLKDDQARPEGATVPADSAFRIGFRQFAGIYAEVYPVQFNSFYNMTASSYEWDFGDGGTSTEANPSHNYTKPGVYKVCVTIRGNNSCMNSICNTYSISRSGQPFQTFVSAKAGADTSDKNLTQFNQNTRGGKLPYTYLWNFGDGQFSNEANPAHSYEIGGSYPVILKVKDAAGDIVSANYNTSTQSDVSSCVANFSLNPTGLLNMNLAKVLLSWIDSKGVKYSSDKKAQPGGAFFEILSSENFDMNENGEKTRKIRARFKCRLYSLIKEVEIESDNTEIAVSYE
jgi:hypothetical protein